MICADINLKVYFCDVPTIQIAGNKEECEKAFVELFNDIFIDLKEYVKTEAKITEIKEVGEE